MKAKIKDIEKYRRVVLGLTFAIAIIGFVNTGGIEVLTGAVSLKQATGDYLFVSIFFLVMAIIAAAIMTIPMPKRRTRRKKSK